MSADELPPTPPSVVVNAMSARVGGGLSYLVQQLTALEHLRSAPACEVLTAPWNHDRLARELRSPIRRIRVPGVAARYVYEQAVLPVRAPDDAVLYYPGNFAPFRTRHPVVVTLQNSNYVGPGLEMAHNQGRVRRAKIELSRRSLLRADRVVVVAEWLAEVLVDELPVLGDRVVAIQSGAPTWPEQSAPPANLQVGSGDYLLSLANDYANKRLDLLVEAWGRTGASPALVMVGAIGPEAVDRHRTLVSDSRQGRLIHLGPVADRREVKWLVANAAALVSMSVVEAFPLTPAEAGSVGCPLVLSDIAGHREVAGDHADYVPVDDSDALIDRLRDLSEDRAPWSWDLTWAEHAQRLAGVFGNVAG